MASCVPPDPAVIYHNLELLRRRIPVPRCSCNISTAFLYPSKASYNNPMMIGPTIDYLQRKDPGIIKYYKGESVTLDRRAPLYLQWDRRWAATPYGDNLLMVNGCVPTSLSMAVSGLRHEFISPVDVISHVGPGDIGPTGTSWSFVDRLPEIYGLRVERVPYDQVAINQALADGKIVVMGLGPGQFTFVGHFMVVLGFDGTYYTVNDANSLENSLTPWRFEELTPVSVVWAMSK